MENEVKTQGSGRKNSKIDSPEIENILDLIPSMIAYIDSDLRHTYVNSRYSDEFQSGADPIKGRTMLDVFGEETFGNLRHNFELALSGKKLNFAATIEFHGVSKRFEIFLVPDRAEGKEPNGFMMQLTTDTTDDSPIEYFKDHMESGTVGLHWVDSKGIILWANSAELNMLGYEKEEYLGHHISKFHDDQAVIDDILKQLEAGKTLNDLEVALRHKDGSVRWVLLSSSVLWEKGEFVHTRCFSVDITQQKIAEEARKSLMFRTNEILQSLPAAIYTCDAAGRIEFYNKAALDLWGRKPTVGGDEWSGHWKIYSPVDGTPIPLDESPMAITLQTGKAVYGREIMVERPDGTRRIIAPHPRPVYDQQGKLAGAVNMLIDITEEKLAARGLLASEEKFRAICELVPTVIWMADENGNRSYMNARWTELTGWQPTEAYGEKWADFVHPEDRDKTIAVFRDALTEKKSFALKFRHLVKEGNYLLIQSVGIPHIDANGQLLGLIGIIQNIEYEEQAKKELEEKIRERTKQLALSNEELIKSEERYHHMIDEVQDYSIILLNQDGLIENWNQGAEKIKGYKSGEAIGQHFRIFYSPEDQASGFPDRFLKQAFEKGRALHEGWRVRKNGSRFWGSVVLTVLRNERNELIGYSKVTRDLTERKLAEDALVEKNRKLEMMNQELLTFAYVSSHDLQEPLRKIQAFSSRILDMDGERLTPKSREYFNIVQNSAHRMRLLIEDILTYSRTSSEPKNLVRTNANLIVDEIVQELKLVIEEKGAVVEICQLPELHVIPFQFRQLIFNLIANSLKFSKKEVTPSIKMSHAIVAADAFSILGREAQHYHQITIADNGIGFEPDYSGKIFEVFQRLHNRDAFEGTGVGLAICKKIVEIHDGAIMAEGKLNQGATFHIFLPVLDIP